MTGILSSALSIGLWVLNMIGASETAKQQYVLWVHALFRQDLETGPLAADQVDEAKRKLLEEIKGGGKS